jgi:hypothetical protein
MRAARLNSRVFRQASIKHSRTSIAVPDVIQNVEVTVGDLTVDFKLSLTPVSEQVTVTAIGSAKAIGSSYQPVASVGALELGRETPFLSVTRSRWRRRVWAAGSIARGFPPS